MLRLITLTAVALLLFTYGAAAAEIKPYGTLNYKYSHDENSSGIAYDKLENNGSKIGIDIIKQEKKWFEKHPLLLERIELLERDSHAPCPLEEFDAYPALIKRIEELENKVK